MKFKSIVLAIILFTLTSNPTLAKIIHVPGDSSTIQGGINGTLDGDTVLVARDHYYERINFHGKAVLVTSNFVFDSLTTTIDSTIIDADTSVLGVSDTGSVVVFVSKEDSTSIIQGFTIQNGIGVIFRDSERWGGGIYCDSSSPAIRYNTITANYCNFGGGISCNQSSPIIANNIIANNSAGHGGGIVCEYSSPTISTNTVIDNSSACGGGIWCFGSSPIIDSNTIAGNYASYGGGILCNHYSSATIQNNIISNDTSDTDGGGIRCYKSSPTISNNEIIGCYSGNDGGGIQCLKSSPYIYNNIILNNSTDHGWGGGIYCGDSSSPAISYNTIAGNSAISHSGAGIGCRWDSSPTIHHNIISYNNSTRYGAGICCEQSSPNISFNTINGNSSPENSGGIYCWRSSPIITSNIISNSLDGEGIGCGLDSWPLITYNNVWNNADGNFYNCPTCVGDTSWGTNINGIPCDSFFNIIMNPLFITSDSNNYSLRCNSPCIDAGDPGLPLDPDHTIADIGALYFDQNLHLPPQITSPESSIAIPCHYYTYVATVFDTIQPIAIIEYLNYPSWLTVVNDTIEGMPDITIADTTFEIWADDTCDMIIQEVSVEVLLCGDANYDEETTISDVIYLINYLFKLGPTPLPDVFVADVNCNQSVEITDVVYLINYLFKSGPPPCEAE